MEKLNKAVRTLPRPCAAAQSHPSQAGAGSAWDPSPLAWAALGWQSPGWHRLPLRQMERGGGPRPPAHQGTAGIVCSLEPSHCPPPPRPQTSRLLGAWLGNKKKKKKATSPSQHLCLLPLALAFFPCQPCVPPTPSLALAKTRTQGVRCECGGWGRKEAEGAGGGWWELPPSPEAALTRHRAPISPSTQIDSLGPPDSNQ